jgi:hypothetical protein
MTLVWAVPDRIPGTFPEEVGTAFQPNEKAPVELGNSLEALDR